MMDLDRRSMIGASLVAGMAALVPVSLSAATSAPSLFIFDARFPASARRAEGWRGRGIPVLDPRIDDLGIAWRERIPGLLRRHGRIEGTTLWSDRFICESFGRDFGLQMSLAEPQPDLRSPAGLQSWTLA